MNDQKLDLNLLLVFEALMRERSVTRAARQLGIGQPAASNALARLRSLLRDELFLRSGSRMVPTARALQLADPIETALAGLRAAIAPEDSFDPASARRRFRISAGDYAGMLLLPALTLALRTEAPDVDLRFRFIEKDRVTELTDSGELDLAIGVFTDPPKRFSLRPLYEERFVCLACARHPGLAGGLTLERYAELPHILVTERGDEIGAVDDALRRVGLRRRVAVTVPHALLLPGFLCNSDLIATVAARAARAFAASGILAVHQTPVAMPSWKLSMLWSRQRAGDAGLAWLCDRIAAIAATL